MNPSTETVDLTHFDVRVIPCRQKHAMIFQRWAALPVGEHFVLINDHDPVPLYYQFAGQHPGTFTWEYLATGPEEYRVKITRVAASPTAPATPPPAIQKKPVTAGELLDVRGYEPPAPMMHILNAVSSMAPGSTLRAHTDRRPLHLLPELDARGVRHVSEEQADGSWITTLCRG
jgi:uncharacterized protein (DUF2249 family)